MEAADAYEASAPNSRTIDKCRSDFNHYVAGGLATRIP